MITVVGFEPTILSVVPSIHWMLASLALQVLVLLRRTHPHFVRTLDYFVIESKSDTFTLFGYKQMLMDLNHY